MSEHQKKPVPRWQAGDWFFRLGIPCYIAAGAVMKLLTGRPLELPLVSLQLDPSPELERWAGIALPVVAAVELALAGAILLGGRWARWLALAVLVAFAAVLIPHVRAAAVSCGCFGTVHANPTLMLITAVGSALLILLLPATGAPPAQCTPRWVGPWVVAAVLLTAGVHAGQLPERLGWRVPTVRMRPDGWVGARLSELPFYPFLESDADVTTAPPFAEGEQTWVLWLRSCPHCHEYFRERWSVPSQRRIVAVEVPPSAAGISSEPHTIECPSCVRMHLKKGTFYFLPRTPVILTVKDGLVTAVDVNPAPVPMETNPSLELP